MTAIANQNIAAAAIGDRVDPGLGPKQNPTVGKDCRAALPHVAVGSTVDKSQNTAKNRPVKPEDPRRTDRVERIIVGIVLFVLTVVPLLTFLFSFGNVGDLGTSLGIDERIAYLTGPAVDLTATGMIVAATWLSYKGRTEKELWRVHALSIICALIMFALNCGPAIYQRRFELAGFSAVGPFLLMAMGFVGPWLLRQITDSPELVAAAPGTRQKKAATETAAATPAAADPAAMATATEPAVPESPSGNQTPAAAPGSGNRTSATVVAIDGSGRRSAADWAELALPLWRRYTDNHRGETPTAPVLANLLRNAHPDLPVPGSPRSERNIRAAVEDLLDGADDESERAEAVS